MSATDAELHPTTIINRYLYIFTFREYSAFKKADRSYHYVHESRGERISFIAVNACPNPAPKRPFNFFGVLSQVSPQSTHTISCILHHCFILGMLVIFKADFVIKHKIILGHLCLQLITHKRKFCNIRDLLPQRSLKENRLMFYPTIC